MIMASNTIQSVLPDDGIMQKIRRELSQYFNNAWPEDVPILWQNMPAPIPQSDQGWVRFICRIERMKKIGISRNHRAVYGRIHAVVAIPRGTGMAQADAMMDQLIKLFSTSNIGDIRLGEVTMNFPNDEHGQHLIGLTVLFSLVD